MNWQLRFVFVIFFITAILIFTAQLRNTNNRLFYKLCSEQIEQNRLKQQLWQKQLQVEIILSPASISESIQDK